jgi:hypothetical protein
MTDTIDVVAANIQCRAGACGTNLDGLVEWLPTRLIVWRWTERKAFQEDEERAARLSASDAEVWDPVCERPSRP